MKSVDAVDVGLELLPRRWVRVAVLLVLAWILLTGNYAPFIWYAHAKADQVMEMLTPALERFAAPTVEPGAGE
jgi:hypothetical protein